MERTGLRQPYMAVDASTLIEPPLLESGIRADTDNVLPSIVEIVSYVIVM